MIKYIFSGLYKSLERLVTWNFAFRSLERYADRMVKWFIVFNIRKIFQNCIKVKYVIAIYIYIMAIFS